MTRNVNVLVGELVETALGHSLDELEYQFRLILVKHINFCFACGTLETNNTICNECVNDHLEKMEAKYGKIEK